MPRMTLLEEIQSRTLKEPCPFGRWLATAPKQDREDLASIFPHPKQYSSQLIADVLSSRIEGWIVDSIRKHRRGVCNHCPRTSDFLNVAP